MAKRRRRARGEGGEERPAESRAETAAEADAAPTGGETTSDPEAVAVVASAAVAESAMPTVEVTSTSEIAIAEVVAGPGPAGAPGSAPRREPSVIVEVVSIVEATATPRAEAASAEQRTSVALPVPEAAAEPVAVKVSVAPASTVARTPVIPASASAKPPAVVPAPASPDEAEWGVFGLAVSQMIEIPEELRVGDESGGSGWARAMRRLSPRLLAFILVLVLGAGVAGTVITLVNPFGDWFMHLLMYVVMVSFFLLYLKAHARRRTFARYATMTVSVALMGFFAWILAGLVPAKKVWYARSVVWREETPVLFAPIVLLVLAGVLLAFHCVAVSRHASRARVERAV